jgi:hypothetical protein
MSGNEFSSTPVQFTKIMFQEISEIQLKDYEFKEAVKRLKKNYTLAKIGKLQRKYLKKPEQLREKVREMANNFVKDYTTFRMKYVNYFYLINQTIESSGKELSLELHDIDNMVKTLIGRVSTGSERLYFPPATIKKFTQEFKKAMRKLAKQIHIEYFEYVGASKGKRLGTGIFSKLIGNRMAVRTGKRKVKELFTQVNLTQEIANQIGQEIKTGIRMDFMALLLRYVMELEKTDKSLKQIKKYLVVILDNVEGEIRKVVSSVAKFILVIESDPYVKNSIETARKAFVDEQNKVIGLIKDEKKWPQFEESIAMDVNKNEAKLIALLANIDGKSIQSTVDARVKTELGFAH